jgi:1-acyl-sn-glycerol-3-phosphate acyltransferase
VKRESRESRQAAAEKIVEVVSQNKNVVIYPEGGCKGRHIYHTFKHGAFDISLQTGIPVLPVFLHYESQDDFEWRAPQTLIQKIWHMMTTQNHRVNYYLYDAIHPEKFSSKEEFNDHVHKLYLKWQASYLD